MHGPWTSRLILLALAGVAAGFTGCQSSPSRLDRGTITSVDDLDWLSGHWIQRSADGSAVNEEFWLAPAGGLMVGVNRTLEEDRAIFFEFLMIREVDGRIAYLAMPGGRSPPTPFPMSSGAGWSIVFENPDHDFPQRIHYARAGDALTAILSGGGNGGVRTETWHWRKVD